MTLHHFKPQPYARLLMGSSSQTIRQEWDSSTSRGEQEDSKLGVKDFHYMKKITLSRKDFKINIRMVANTKNMINMMIC